jgi:hypothetical protein
MMVTMNSRYPRTLTEGEKNYLGTTGDTVEEPKDVRQVFLVRDWTGTAELESWLNNSAGWVMLRVFPPTQGVPGYVIFDKWEEVENDEKPEETDSQGEGAKPC